MYLARTIYSLVGAAITPALHVWLRRRAARGKEDPFRLAERFGYPSLPRPAGVLVWLHAASVGETQSVLTLVRALLAEHPEIHLLITTGTVTSAALVAQQNLPRVIHQFVPVDTKKSVRQFLRHWQPDIALWVESEFWPQLLWQARDQCIPMLLINARISVNTYKSWKRWPKLIRDLLRSFCSIYAGSNDDATRLRDLGGADIRNVGNLKYDAAPLPVDEKLVGEITHASNGRPIFVAASTHANEEQLLAEVHQLVAQQFPDLLTVIVPRHARRGDAIAADLRARSLPLAQRSKSETISPATAIYLADTMGELGSFYNVADIVFMGGSLIAHGGQNPLEAARMGKVLITGPYTHNFAAIIDRLMEADAIHVALDKECLAQQVMTLLCDGPERGAMAMRAQQAVEQARGASSIILQQCSELLARSGA